MVGPTIIIAAIGSILALMARPGAAVGIIVASFLLWPNYLRIPIGPMQMSSARIIASVLLARMFFSSRHATVQWSWPDALIVAHYLWNIIAGVSAGADELFMNTTLGSAFDTIVMYMCARLAIQSPADFKDAILPLGLTAISLGILGFGEAITSRSPYQRLIRYHTWMWFDKAPDYRFRMLRASASASHAIYFGMTMCVLTGMLWSLRKYAKSPSLHMVFVGFALLGTLSSLSSGPMMGLVATFILCSFFYYPTLIYPGLAALIATSILFEFLSTRHFYNLIDYLALNKGTAWYRTRLMEVAFANLSEYWAVGVGSNWPHHWGQQIDTRNHVDVVNNFIIVALNGGLLGLTIFSSTMVGVVRNATRCYKRSPSMSQKALAFGLACTIIGILTASMSVGLFGPPKLILYITLGMTMSLRPLQLTVRNSRVIATDTTTTLAQSYPHPHTHMHT